MFQRRFKKERKVRRKLADQLAAEARRRRHFEEALKSAAPDVYRSVNGQLNAIGSDDSDITLVLRCTEKANQEMEEDRKAELASPVCHQKAGDLDAGTLTSGKSRLISRTSAIKNASIRSQTDNRGTFFSKNSLLFANLS